MADITPEKRQEFTQLSNEYGDTVDSVNEFSDADVSDGAFILPGYMEGNAQQGILPKWGKVTYARLRKPIVDAMAEWNGDGTAQNPGMEARVNAAVSAAEAVSVEWQGADGTGGIKKQAQDATAGASNVNASLSGTTITVTNRNGQSNSANLKGETGDAAGFGNPTTSVQDNTPGTPSVEVSASGPDTAKVFAFTFHHLKGEQGDKPVITAESDGTIKADGAVLTTAVKDAAALATQKAGDANNAAQTAAQKAGDANDAAGMANIAATGAENVNAQWNGTTTQLIVTDRTGTSVTKDLKGEKGDTGDPFAIYRTYASVSAMTADASNVPAGKFVCIASNVEDPDNAKLYVKNSSGSFTFLTDLSGAQGIKGDKGDEPALTANNAGEIFSDGVLLTDAIKNAVNAFTSNEGTSTSPRTENSRWGKYAQAEYDRGQSYQTAEQSRSTSYNTAEGISSSVAGDGSRWGAYKSAESTRNTEWGTYKDGKDQDWTSYKSAKDTNWNTYKDGKDQDWTSYKSTKDTDWTNYKAAKDSDWTTYKNGKTTEWNTWFGTDDSTGVRKDVKDAIDAAENVNATLSGTTITVTDRTGHSTSADVKGPKGDKGDNLDWESMTPAEKQALADEVLAEIGFDDVPTPDSNKAVKSGGLYNAFALKEDKSNVASVATCQAIVDELT